MRTLITKLIALIPIIGLSLLLSQPASAQSPGCKLLIAASTGFIDGHDNAAGIGPGDTICLLPGSRSWTWIRYLHGTAEEPIVIMNTIGMVTVNNPNYGIKIDSCSYIKLSGKGVGAFPYGITVSAVNGDGVIIENLSTGVEVEGIEIYNTLFAGLKCKSDPDCSFTSTRDKYTMRNVSIHDNYMHDIGTEGLYIGNSFYSGFEINCNGKDTILLPHLIRGLKVYNNTLVRTGWDGIQVSCADSGCTVYSNEVYNDSEDQEVNQMSGILLGEGSGCDCFNNKVLYGKGTGIEVHGLGGNKIYNNLIVNPGIGFQPEFPYMNGIYIGDQPTTPGTNFVVAYNTIISPKDFGIDFRSMTTTGNLFVNNIVMNYGRGVSQGSNIAVQNNSTFPTLDPAQFVDLGADDYDLKPTSVANNAAIAVSQLNLDFDILNRNRPFGVAKDIGAYECQVPIAIPELDKNHTIQLTIASAEHPNHLILRYSTMGHMHTQIGLYDLMGRLTGMIVDKQLAPGKYKQEIDISRYSDGIYIFRMTAGNEYISRKFI